MQRLRRSGIPGWRRIVPLFALALAFGSGHDVVVQAAEGDLDPTLGQAAR